MAYFDFMEEMGNNFMLVTLPKVFLLSGRLTLQCNVEGWAILYQLIVDVTGHMQLLCTYDGMNRVPHLEHDWLLMNSTHWLFCRVSICCERDFTTRVGFIRV